MTVGTDEVSNFLDKDRIIFWHFETYFQTFIKFKVTWLVCSQITDRHLFFAISLHDFICVQNIINTERHEHVTKDHVKLIYAYCSNVFVKSLLLQYYLIGRKQYVYHESSSSNLIYCIHWHEVRYAVHLKI